MSSLQTGERRANGGAQRRVSVVGAVIVRDGLILAAQRGPEMATPGVWEFPGGKVEPGETPAEALRRELREELGCEVGVGDLVARSEHEYPGGTVVLATYRCTLRAGEPRAIEHRGLRWLTAAELGDLAWAPADLPTVRLIAAAAAQPE